MSAAALVAAFGWCVYPDQSWSAIYAVRGIRVRLFCCCCVSRDLSSGRRQIVAFMPVVCAGT
eukprot:3098714-Rhodomonas_salina.4